MDKTTVFIPCYQTVWRHRWRRTGWKAELSDEHGQTGEESDTHPKFLYQKLVPCIIPYSQRRESPHGRLKTLKNSGVLI